MRQNETFTYLSPHARRTVRAGLCAESLCTAMQNNQAKLITAMAMAMLYDWHFYQ
jgi:hypothetical protein